jgi:hypothetical protein
MTWNEAVEGTLEAWYGIRDSIGMASDLELLTEINAVCPLCEKAADVATNPVQRCEHCPVARQCGGCYGIGGEMSECIAAHDLEGLAELVDEFIARLEAVRIPVEPGWPPADGEFARYVEML